MEQKLVEKMLKAYKMEQKRVEKMLKAERKGPNMGKKWVADTEARDIGVRGREKQKRKFPENPDNWRPRLFKTFFRLPVALLPTYFRRFNY